MSNRWLTKEERLLMRAREIIAFHNKSLNDGPLPCADQLTDADVAAAQCIVAESPQLRRQLRSAEVCYPPEWETNKRSLANVLSAFHRNAIENQSAKIVYLEDKLSQAERDLSSTQAEMLSLTSKAGRRKNGKAAK